MLDIDEILDFDEDVAGRVRDSVMVIGLSGWFDAASVATRALTWMSKDTPSAVVASIDPDPFFDFTQQRPEAYLDEDGDRQIRWPTNDFEVLRYSDSMRDVVVLNGVEPHAHWASFIGCITSVYERLGSSLVVTVGANADAVPHTRMPRVVGSSTNEDLCRRLGLNKPQYQGITGVAGVLQTELDRLSIPAISLRVGVPHYLGGAQHPRSVVALLQHLQHVLGVKTGHEKLSGEITRWQELHNAAVDEDDQAKRYLRMLEIDFDRRIEAEIPTGDDLAAELEEFLRGQTPPDEDDAN